MSKGISLDTIRTCEAYRRALANGTNPSDIVTELAVDYGVNRPAIWRRLRAGGVLPQYQPRKEGGRGRPQGGGEPGWTEKRQKLAQEAIERKRTAASRPRVDRDPCPRCGVRGDLNCDHSRVRLGTVL